MTFATFYLVYGVIVGVAALSVAVGGYVNRRYARPLPRKGKGRRRSNALTFTIGRRRRPARHVGRRYSQ